MRNNQPMFITGDCECCRNTEVAVTRRRDSLMCLDCIKLEDDAIAKQKSVEIIEKSIAIDETIALQKDIHNAATVGFIELRAAIQNNDTIPAEQKEYELYRMAAERIKLMKAAIIAHDTQGMSMKNEHHAWFTQVQEVASRLRGEYREKAKQHDLSYQPVSPKTVKSKPVKTASESSKAEIRKAVREAAAKYGVDSSTVSMMLLGDNQRTPESAAKELAKLLGKL